MTKKDFMRRVIISFALTAIAIALIITFFICVFIQYAKPNGDNTSISSGTVADIYHGGKNMGVIVEMSNGDRLQLVYPNFSDELYSAIGYDLDELCDLLEGEEIVYRRMNRLPWVTEIYADDIVINNGELTNKQIILSHIAIAITGLITLAFPICTDIAYIQKQYKHYKKAEKKRVRRARRRSGAAQ